MDVWAGHPLRDEALGTLERMRAQLSDLRKRINLHNDEHGLGADLDRVVIYAGQCVLPDEGSTLRSEPERNEEEP